jgi:hypothetical protein
MTIPKKQKGRSSSKSAAPNIPANKFTQLRLTKLQIQRRTALRSILLRHPGNNTAAQRQRLLAAMEEIHNITTFEAMRYLDVYDPRPRILELRRAGHSIATVIKRERTECNVLHRIGLYFLTPSPQLPLEGI